MSPADPDVIPYCPHPLLPSVEGIDNKAEEAPMTSTTTVHVHPRHRSDVRWSTDLASVLAAGICALITWLVVAKAGGVDLRVDIGGQMHQVDAVDVVLTAIGSALAGFAFLRTLERLTTRAITIWTAVAVVVALCSLLGPLGAGTPTVTLALISLHAVVATVIIVAARRSRRSRR